MGPPPLQISIPVNPPPRWFPLHDIGFFPFPSSHPSPQQPVHIPHAPIVFNDFPPTTHGNPDVLPPQGSPSIPSKYYGGPVIIPGPSHRETTNGPGFSTGIYHAGQFGPDVSHRSFHGIPFVPSVSHIFWSRPFVNLGKYHGNPSVNMRKYHGIPSVNIGTYHGIPSFNVRKYQEIPSSNIGKYHGIPSVNIGKYKGIPSVNIGKYQGIQSGSPFIEKYQGIQGPSTHLKKYHGMLSRPSENTGKYHGVRPDAPSNVGKYHGHSVNQGSVPFSNRVKYQGGRPNMPHANFGKYHAVQSHGAVANLRKFHDSRTNEPKANNHSPLRSNVKYFARGANTNTLSPANDLQEFQFGHAPFNQNIINWRKYAGHWPNAGFPFRR